MNKCLQITALLLGYSVIFAAVAAPVPAVKPVLQKPVVTATAAPSAVKPPKAVVYADQPLPAGQPKATEAKSQAQTEPLPSPLIPGERVVAALDPKEDFIILGKEEPDPVPPAAPTVVSEAEKSILPLVDALGLGHTEPPPMKAPVTVSNGIVPPGPVLTPVVMVAGPNIGAKPALPKAPAKKAQAHKAIKKAVTVVLKPLTPAPLEAKPSAAPEIKPAIKPIIVAERKAKPAVQAKPNNAVFKQKQTPVKVKPARQAPVNHGPVNPNPVKRGAAAITKAKPVLVKSKHLIQEIPHSAVHHANVKTPVITHPAKLTAPVVKHAVTIKKAEKVAKLKKAEKLVFKPVVKSFVPVRHAAAAPITHKPVIKKLAAKPFVFKPVIKPYRQA